MYFLHFISLFRNSYSGTCEYTYIYICTCKPNTRHLPFQIVDRRLYLVARLILMQSRMWHPDSEFRKRRANHYLDPEHRRISYLVSFERAFLQLVEYPDRLFWNGSIILHKLDSNNVSYNALKWDLVSSSPISSFSYCFSAVLKSKSDLLL